MNLLTTKELAAATKMSVACIRAWRRQGMPYHPFGRHQRWELSAVMEWLRQRAEKKAVTPAAPSPAKPTIQEEAANLVQRRKAA